MKKYVFSLLLLIIFNNFTYSQACTDPLKYANNCDFDNDGKLVSSGSTATAIETSNFILTTDEPSGIVTWTSILDGGEY